MYGSHHLHLPGNGVSPVATSTNGPPPNEDLNLVGLAQIKPLPPLPSMHSVNPNNAPNPRPLDPPRPSSTPSASLPSTRRRLQTSLIPVSKPSRDSAKGPGSNQVQARKHAADGMLSTPVSSGRK
jgi:hypothetical protein